jgi:hypothetical protein
LTWEEPSDPSGIDSYRVRLAKFGADFTEEQLFDGLPAGQVELTFQAECGASYGWQVLARDGAGNEGAESTRAHFEVDAATSAPTSLSPANYRHLSCVAQIILRWEAPNDPEGIFGYMVTLQTVLDAGSYGEALTFGWMEAIQYDATRATDCGKTYRWRVFASDLQMNDGLRSEWAYFIINAPGQ